MALEIERIPVLNDNYVWLAHEPSTGMTAVVDPAEAEPVLERAAAKGWRITHILNTHHHWDHVGGNLAIVEQTGATVVGARIDAPRIPGIQLHVGEGDVVHLGAAAARVFEVPGHTSGHIVYWFAEDRALFCGDTLFLMGCGRVIEGTHEQMWASLSKFAVMPDHTRVYCAHEYTLANARFALTVEPDNAALRDRFAAVERARAAGEATVPGLLGEERATNPFLRAGSVSGFATRRKAKDDFRG